MKHTIKLALAFVLITVLFVWTLPTKSLACHLTVDCWMSDTEGRPIPGNIFDIVLKKNGTVTSTNPGGFFYYIQFDTEDWFWNSIQITPSLPPQFDVHGGNPVKVFLNGAQIYNGSLPIPALTDVDPHSVVTVQIHVKYVKGLVPPPCPHTYFFGADFVLVPDYDISGSAECTLTDECP